MVVVTDPAKLELTKSLPVAVPDKLIVAVSSDAPPVKSTTEPLELIVPVLVMVTFPVVVFVST